MLYFFAFLHPLKLKKPILSLIIPFISVTVTLSFILQLKEVHKSFYSKYYDLNNKGKATKVFLL